ncbi:hypothetical protein [Ramlibacter montanisoli]|uniref:Uncharacterized protein n=1 Tax=Ramlibacter montanisoli TaxID=2732512 RepID=A0A849K852_9BURK|nr:hypothetical protein [Ramlibacter montanisoli]NNU44532.1 hypothetical protein [Ramlibacter montanisoli]
MKRPAGGQVAKPVRAQGARHPRPAPRQELEAAPAALPEVVAEGNTQADWSAWEDSMMVLDSQFQALDPGARIQVRDTRPSQLDELDPFAGVASRRQR